MPTLFLVGTPIGNLEDITLRAVRVLGEVSLIAAEDTRTSGRLLQHYNIDTPLVSYHDFSGPERIAALLARLAQGDVALISDAGMPGLSDPGYRLVRAAVEAGADVVPIPGPSAAVTALISSGLPSDSFLFLGFLPRQTKARRETLTGAASLAHTLILYEAPHRLLDTLSDIEAILGDRQLMVGRELTKLHEELYRGTVQEARSHFEAGPLRGEFTLVVAGAAAEEQRWNEELVRQALVQELASGSRRKQAVKRVAQLAGWRTRDVYRLSLEL
ncbi:MAG: 16S rRNA (cytidine(1402)-2'-O)-methyltransferase [Candidatus Promineifilaceae bacterium]|nr:16S rRNA (cytidine(1402)-2'-O)-methyltransferase [Candidatus Promineifilaceae bacterium]